MKTRILILICLLAAFNALADSPLTSTFFAGAYSDIPMINELITQRNHKEIHKFQLTEAHIKFFDNNAISLDKKVALINALGWGESENIQLMKGHLMKKYKLQQMVLDSILQVPVYENQDFYEPAKVISNDDLLLLAYVQAMHDYFHPMNAFQCAYRATINNPISAATGYVFGLIQAQFYMDIDPCSIYLVMLSAREARSYSEDFLRPDALTSIFSYIDQYEKKCSESDDDRTDESAIESPFYLLEYSQDYWREYPVYEKPLQKLLSDKKNKVDLVLMNTRSDKIPMLEHWIFYDEDIDGTSIDVTISNKGNIASIETNLLITIDNTIDQIALGLMYIQQKIPAIVAGQSVTVRVSLPNYWIYDTHADFTIQVDFDDNILESDEKNNRRDFHERG